MIIVTDETRLNKVLNEVLCPIMETEAGSAYLIEQIMDKVKENRINQQGIKIAIEIKL